MSQKEKTTCLQERRNLVKGQVQSFKKVKGQLFLNFSPRPPPLRYLE